MTDKSISILPVEQNASLLLEKVNTKLIQDIT